MRLLLSFLALAAALPVLIAQNNDIVFVVDSSGSMSKGPDGKMSWLGREKMKRIQDFMVKFTQSLGGEDVRFAMSQNPKSRYCKIPRCKEGEKDWSAEYHLPAGHVCRVCAGRHFDIVFVVDSSGSMSKGPDGKMSWLGREKMKRIQDFMVKFTQSLGEEDVRFAMSQNPKLRYCKIPRSAHVDDCEVFFTFEETFNYHMEFANCAVGNQSCISDMIYDLKFTGGTSCHGVMMNLTYHHFFGDGYQPAEKREKVMIFFTDGMTNCVRYTSKYNSSKKKLDYVRNKDQETNDQVDEIARDIRRHGVRTIFIGVGPELNLAHIRRMAGNARDGQHIAAFEEMSNEKILDEFRSRVCDEMLIILQRRVMK